MINITRAQAQQLTVNGEDKEWIVTLEGEELYRLPPHFTVQETFEIRDIIQAMMARASEETKEQEEQLYRVKLEHIVSVGNEQLEALKNENIRLSGVLDQHIGEAS